ncbi:MAG TPA: DUF2934 domain-containing protein [Bryobacteraceae bacterium]|jgi:hypothetical protein
MEVRAASRADVWQEYRTAFEDFAQKVRNLQILGAIAGVEQKSIDRALLELEQARNLYNRRRDALAEQYLPVPAPVSNRSHAGVNSVKDLAALRWEISGRPDGTAEDDWYRAEEIVSLSKPGCC